MSVIAVDLGSTAVKAVVVDDAGAFAHEPLRVPMPSPRSGQPDRHEVPASAVLEVVTGLVERLAQHPSGPSEVRLSGQSHGYVLVGDRPEDARFVSWQDRRAEARDADGVAASTALNALLDPGWRARAGVRMKPGLPLANLFADARAGGLAAPALLLSLGGYLALQWCGVAAIHDTQAASTGLYDIRNREWSTPTTALLEGRVRLPQLVDEGTPVGEARFAGRPVPVFPEVADHAAAVHGALAATGLGDEHALVVTVGTAGLVARRSDAPRALTDREVRPGLAGAWLEVVPRMPGGWQLASLAAGIREPVASLLGGPPDESGVWAAVATALELTGASAAIGARYAEAFRVLLDGASPEDVVYCGGVLERNPGLVAAIADASASRAHHVREDASLRGLALLSIRQETP